MKITLNNTPLFLAPHFEDTLGNGVIELNIAQEAIDSFTSREVEDGVATIPVKGILVNRGAGLDGSFGVTSYEFIRRHINEIEANEAIHTIKLDIDSGGGMVSGLFEAVDAVKASTKRVVAVVDQGAFSAAYAIAAMADQIELTRTSGVGSIGVIFRHISIADALEGADVTTIKIGRKKDQLNPLNRLSDEAVAQVSAELEEMMQMFVDVVVEGRGISEEAVRATEAGTFIGKSGVNAGLGDRVEQLAVIERDLLEAVDAGPESTGEVIEGEVNPDNNRRPIIEGHPAAAGEEIPTSLAAAITEAGGSPEDEMTPEEMKAASEAAKANGEMIDPETVEVEAARKSKKVEEVVEELVEKKEDEKADKVEDKVEEKVEEKKDEVVVEKPEAPKPEVLDPNRPKAPVYRGEYVSDMISACTEANAMNRLQEFLDKKLEAKDVAAVVGMDAEITAMCASSGQGDATAFIKAGLSVDQVKAKLYDAMVATDEQTEVDASVEVDANEAPQAADEATTLASLAAGHYGKSVK